MPDKKQIEKLTRAVSIVPGTFNEKDNTIELVAATEDMRVLRRSWSIGTFYEILSMTDGHVRLDRLNSGANVLDNHDNYSSVREAVVGVIEKAWVADKKLYVKVRFSNREDVKPLIEDVKNGIIRNVSIGYNVFKYLITEEEGATPEYRAIDWEPCEVSFVSIPADYLAGVRSKSDLTNEVEIISNNQKNNTMNRSSEILKLVRAAGLSLEFAQTLIDDETITVDKARTMIEAEKTKAAAPPVPGEDADKIRKEAAKTERKRGSDILSAVRAAGLDNEFAETLIADENITVDQARAKIIEKLAESGTQRNNQKPAGDVIIVGAEETEKFRNAAVTGMLLRSGQIPEKDLKSELVVAGRSFQGTSLIRFAAMCLERAGINTSGLSDIEIAKRAITSSTSDFPVVLENVLHKMLLASYATVPDTWRRFCQVGTVTDFRDHKRLRPGSLSKLDKVGENGELKTKALVDAKSEKIAADTKGNIINVSRNMIINDDLGYFSRLTSDLGKAAARTIEIDVYALLALNSGNGPVMADGNTLFHANHSNIITGAAPSVASFDAIKVKMAQQKDHNNNDILDITPSILLLGVHQSAAADAVNDSLYDPDAANKLQKKNTSYKTFRDLVSTARIIGNEQYAFADPSVLPVLEVAFLNGVQTPYLEQEQSFQQLGLQWRVYTDYGVGAIDWKGAVKNPGA